MSAEAKVSLPKLSKQEKADQRAKDEATIEAFKTLIKYFLKPDMVNLEKSWPRDDVNRKATSRGNQQKVSGKKGDEETDVALVKTALEPVLEDAYVSLVRDGLGGTIYFAHCSQMFAELDAEVRAAAHDLLQTRLMHAGQEFSIPFLLKATELATGEKLQLESNFNDGIMSTNEIYEFIDDKLCVTPKARGRGQPSQWNKVELEQAVRKALDLLPDKNRRTLQTVGNLLKEAYPKKAPPTASALKQLMIRLGVDWKALKKEQ